MTHQYRGLSYSAASREGLRLIEQAVETGSWFDLPDKLIELRETMQRELPRERQMAQAMEPSYRVEMLTGEKKFTLPKLDVTEAADGSYVLKLRA